MHIGNTGIDIVEKVADIGNCSADMHNKFEKFKLNTRSAAIVQVSMIEDCLFNIECRVASIEMVKYNLFMLEAIAVWKNSSKAEARSFHPHGNWAVFIKQRVC